ncbi:hypothetical protein LDENG_00086160 [Lucifuga dentata]|nr:hypothetical protein LDENG_00086160 [Lucifuga dentata]
MFCLLMVMQPYEVTVILNFFDKRRSSFVIIFPGGDIYSLSIFIARKRQNYETSKKPEYTSCSRGWITYPKNVSRINKLIFIAYQNELKPMAVRKVGNFFLNSPF